MNDTKIVISHLNPKSHQSKGETVTAGSEVKFEANQVFSTSQKSSDHHIKVKRTSSIPIRTRCESLRRIALIILSLACPQIGNVEMTEIINLLSQMGLRVRLKSTTAPQSTEWHLMLEEIHITYLYASDLFNVLTPPPPIGTTRATTQQF